MWWAKRKSDERPKAVAYYRHSAQDRQENSIPIQRQQVRAFAETNQIDIVREFADAGKSGLSLFGRDGFKQMLEELDKSRKAFQYVLVLNVSRWGRFQDTDESAYYRAECKRRGKKVIFVSMGLPKEGDLTHNIMVELEAIRAAQASRELSDYVFGGCKRIAQQGFRPGGPGPYGLARALLNEDHHFVQILDPGKKKSLQNYRVTLAPGDKQEQAVVRRIFKLFVDKGQPPEQIAATLNADGIPSPGGSRWSAGMVHSILRNELYIGTMVYNKTRQRLQAPTRRNPKEEWVRTPDAFEAVVPKPLFEKAQAIIEATQTARRRLYSDEDMLAKLKRLYEERGIVTAKAISTREGMVSATTYASHFGALDMAFQGMFADVRAKTRSQVVELLKQKAHQTEEFHDYLILNDSFSVLIQPSVPVPCGHTDYWAFLPDHRPEVDITLGVPLSNNGEYEILGYLSFPRLLVPHRPIRLFSSSDGRLELHGDNSLKVIEDLLS